MHRLLAKKSKINPGDQAGKLTVIGMAFCVREDSGRRTVRFVCECSCGTITVASPKHFGRGVSSCGCLRLDKIKERSCRFHSEHGAHWSAIRKILFGMIHRCTNPRSQAWSNYGGRGISVCHEWMRKRGAFYEWAMLSGYDPSLTIDRIDNNGNYEPDNCRWTTYSENLRNTRVNRMLSAWDETKTVAAWVEDRRCQVSDALLRHRLNSGMPSEEAISRPPRCYRMSYGAA